MLPDNPLPLITPLQCTFLQLPELDLSPLDHPHPPLSINCHAASNLPLPCPEVPVPVQCDSLDREIGEVIKCVLKQAVDFVVL